MYLQIRHIMDNTNRLILEIQQLEVECRNKLKELSSLTKDNFDSPKLCKARQEFHDINHLLIIKKGLLKNVQQNEAKKNDVETAKQRLAREWFVKATNKKNPKNMKKKDSLKWKVSNSLTQNNRAHSTDYIYIRFVSGSYGKNQ